VVGTLGGVAQVPVGGSPVPIGPSQPSALAPEGTVSVILPGVNFPPAGATPVDEIGDADLAPSAANQPLVTIRVPDTLRFRMSGIGFGADDEVALGFLTWAIQLTGGAAVPSYWGQTSAVGSIRQLSNIVLLVGSSQVVTVVANIAADAALTYRYIARVQGWIYQPQQGLE
jgi:hypothetical protein